jgi:hypothetical protein
MASRIFLALSALVWLPYGLYCFFAPGALEGVAGVGSSSTTGSIELRAMYGGLQAAIGTLALAGLLRDSMRRPALLALVFLGGGLALARLAGAVIESELSTYTAMGLFFELVTVAWASWLLGREPALA